MFFNLVSEEMGNFIFMENKYFSPAPSMEGKIIQYSFSYFEMK